MKQYVLQSIIADDTSLIPYRKELNHLTGSVTATILLTQMLYWWKQNKRTPFYKFRTPCNHADYRKGDSWCEELGFGEKELDSAISAICQKERDVRKDKKQDSKEAKGYVRCWQTMDRKTYYEVNEELLESDLIDLFERLANPQKGDYVIPQKEIRQSPKGRLEYIDTETNQENTTETTKETNSSVSNRKNKPQPILLSIPNSLNTPEFIEKWGVLLKTKKWCKKANSTLQNILEELSKYDVEFAIKIMGNTIMNEYQGLIFDNTPEVYEKWKKAKATTPQNQLFQQPHPNTPEKPLYCIVNEWQGKKKWAKVWRWANKVAVLENDTERIEFNSLEVVQMNEYKEPIILR